MRNAIREFSFIIRPLSAFSECVYNRVGKPTRWGVAKISLAYLNWRPTEYDSFDKCKVALQNQVTLAHRDKLKRLLGYTDASDLL